MLKSIVAENKSNGEQHLPIFVNTSKGHSLNSVKWLLSNSQSEYNITKRKIKKIL